ncbi:sigma-70 family RNA polymerase sigma factor [Halobacillus sp. A1]|uniref:RNA polymerase sigma factor n=1 Tax=Halobacillus sp. A1 TaxID=2880262 RepID=UPI0020A63923|nr:sigma-70 family RNA polymerase sigma factor [Halobacillus sp. A1]MCP3031832.1 sigma-70 family RNA polymerase sigma factor [Halobacillus sp. A1]
MRNRDLELYLQMADGNKQSLEAIYDKYEKLLYSFVIKLSGDQTLAEEALQEVFIKLWTKKAVYDESKGKFSSWIVTITRYTAIDLIRKNKKSAVSIEEETDLPEQSDQTTEDLVEWKEQGETIRTAMNQLSIEQKEMVDLFYFKGLSQREIAEQCDIPLGTVKGRIRLALKHLKKNLSTGKGGVYDA